MKTSAITVKPFLNTVLKPQIDPNGKECYGLYYQITFQRKNTQIKSIFNLYFDTLNEIKTNKSVAYETDLLKRHIKFELSRNDKQISLTGIKARYETMAIPVDTILQGYLKNKLARALVGTQSEFLSVLKFEGFNVQFLVLLKAAKLLIENLNKQIDSEFKEEIEAYKCFHKYLVNKSFSTDHFSILDWIDGSHKIELNRYLMAYLEENSKEVMRITTILNIIVEDRIKYIL